MRRCIVRAALAAATALTLAAPSFAAGIATDGSINSSYVWRGLSITNHPVLQPSAYVTVPAGPTEFVVGGWANVEPVKYDGLGDLSQSGGQGAFDLTEVDLWAEASRGFRNVGVTAGVLGYVFPNDAAFTKDFNTVEVYARVRFPKTPLSPSVAWYQDISKVNGAYLEGSLSHALPLRENTALTLGLTAGFSAGQEVDTNSDDLASFSGAGLTHVDASATTSFTTGALKLSPTVHAIFTQDDFTKVTAPGETASAKFWVGMTASWAGSFGGGAAE